MQRLAPLGLVILFACAHGPLTPAEPTLRAKPLKGLAVQRAASGGHAEPVYVGTVYVESLSRFGRFGKRTGGTVGVARGSGGLGIGGFGAGGGGFGGAGGLGTTGTLGGELDGQQRDTRERVEVEAAPFQYARIQLPHRGGPSKFIGRPDHVVARDEKTVVDHLSTFAIDVDTAAYAIARRSLLSGAMPEPTLVRPEEFLNYFAYDYRAPKFAKGLFSIEVDGATSPLDSEDRTHLLRVGLMARPLTNAERMPANLVFLVDTSCSMSSADKLDLAKKSLTIAVEHLRPDDQVAIATYAGGISLVLEPTLARYKGKILAALDALESSGGTAMESGLSLAYAQAAQMQAEGTTTRIIVCSDGDANIGATKPDALLERIRTYVERGVTLSTIGFGDGNYKDAMMEQLANKGNGNYFYVDSERQAERVFGRDLNKMIQDVAKDVKIQVAFDSHVVKRYRLVGYENRAIADEDFRRDEVDAGEIGAGHQVTALYELVLDPHAGEGRLGEVFVRAKRPGEDTAKETSMTITTAMVRRHFERAPADLRFATAVVGGAELLRKGPRAKAWSYAQVISIARGAKSERDPDKLEFLDLMTRASQLAQVH